LNTPVLKRDRERRRQRVRAALSAIVPIRANNWNLRTTRQTVPPVRKSFLRTRYAINKCVRDKDWRGRKLTPKRGKKCELGGVARVAFERIRKHVVHKENISALTEAPKHWVLRNSVHRSSGWGFGADGKERRVCHAHTAVTTACVKRTGAAASVKRRRYEPARAMPLE
jgi:hypothetical protein